MDNILTAVRKEMGDVMELVGKDILRRRSIFAINRFVQDIKVEAYDSVMTLKELASISAPDSQNLLIKPWDETVLKDIEKAIHKSDLGLSPVVDKNMIRVNIPPLTGEQREELAKLVDQKAESGRIMVRQVRSNQKDKVEGKKGEPGVSEDDIHQTMAESQKIVDETINKINELSESRKKEITTL